MSLRNTWPLSRTSIRLSKNLKKLMEGIPLFLFQRNMVMTFTFTSMESFTKKTSVTTSKLTLKTLTKMRQNS